MQTEFATKLDELNQQIMHLQEENERYQSLTTGVSMESFHEDDQEFWQVKYGYILIFLKIHCRSKFLTF